MTDEEGMTWWNALNEQDRCYWLAQANSARPVDAWRAFLKSLESGDSAR